MYKLKLVCSTTVINMTVYVKYQAIRQNITIVIYHSSGRYAVKTYMVANNFINALTDVFVRINKPFF